MVLVYHSSKVQNWGTHLDEVHEDELAEDGGDAQQREAVTHVEDRVLQGELPCQPVHSDDELYTVRLTQQPELSTALCETSPWPDNVESS